ncbi:MAG: ABC-type transport system, involved in lipoprotein release, permease component [Actinomycetia bacterium]|nr:ABC-type transport system, involved in lipoprotein release, permease component [Actinomycetes bacterium]
MWVRADLRRRWRSWVVLGVLAGATVGLGAAGVAGARRSTGAVPRFARASAAPDAAVLANNPAYGPRQRAAVAALPEVRVVYPFAVAIALQVVSPRGMDIGLVPTAPVSVHPMAGVLVAGRLPDPAKADEVVVDENAHRRFGLTIGSEMTVRQASPGPGEGNSIPPELMPKNPNLAFAARLRVVGIAKSVSSDIGVVPSSGFYDKYGDRLVVLGNEFVSLRHGEADFLRFQRDVTRVTGMQLNVENAVDLFGLRQARNETRVEADGLLLFALAAIVVGGVLVGQALVRAVTAGAAELPAWRAIGADRRIVVPAMALPAVVAAVTGAVTSIAVAIGLSSRFPLGVARRYDLDPGFHADAVVLAAAATGVVVATVLSAYVAAAVRALRSDAHRGRPSRAGSLAATMGLPPAFVIGSRLAIEPGRGRNAVPVRSALVGAVVGVLGVAACLTFRAGIEDAITSPARSGIVWDYAVSSGAGPVASRDVATIAADRDVSTVLRATWARAVRINGVPTPTFGTANVKGVLPLVVLTGRAPKRPDEIAFGPSTMHALKLHVGDSVAVGATRTRQVRVVGEALLPPTSHTGYDQSGWMTTPGLERSLASPTGQKLLDVEDYLLVRWHSGANVAAAQRRIAAVGGPGTYYSVPAALPTTVVDLGHLRSLPLALGVFFGLLATATVAHALVTTVRRRNHDLAVLRSLGFTRRNSRVAIAWQATLLAIAGVAVGLPLGIVTGRAIWRWLADNFPIVYVPPVALVALLLIVPVAIVIANALAAGPAHAATRISPAKALRTE